MPASCKSPTSCESCSHRLVRLPAARGKILRASRTMKTPSFAYASGSDRNKLSLKPHRSQHGLGPHACTHLRDIRYDGSQSLSPEDNFHESLVFRRRYFLLGGLLGSYFLSPRPLWTEQAAKAYEQRRHVLPRCGQSHLPAVVSHWKSGQDFRREGPQPSRVVPVPESSREPGPRGRIFGSDAS